VMADSCSHAKMDQGKTAWGCHGDKIKDMEKKGDGASYKNYSVRLLKNSCFVQPVTGEFWKSHFYPPRSCFGRVEVRF